MAQIQLPKNIIKMFNNIQINGIDYKTEETAVSPSAQQILAENRESAQNILQSSIEQEIGQEVKAVELNETLHNVKDESARNNILKEVSTRASEITRVEGLIESEASTRASEITRVEGLIESEASTRASTDAKLQEGINTEASTRASTDATLNNNINTINSKIPSQASKTNQLADKDFVNSSIATNTANFIGTFTDIEELKRQPATNNDYAFWLTTDSAGNILFKRYKYIASTNSWVFEYDLNNSSFTSEQWLAIQSGITSVLVAKLKGIEEGAQVNTITGVKGGHESSYRTGNVNITKDNVGLGNVVNTGDSAIPTSGGTTKFTTGGAYTELAKKNDKITITDDSSTALTDEDTFSTTGNTGTNPTNLTKRPLSLLWTYIKGKISSVLGLTATAYGGKASTAETADKTKNDITMTIPYVAESGWYVIPLGNILEPTSTEINSPYIWDITGFFSIIRDSGHNGSHVKFEAGHGYSHAWRTYAYLDSENFDFVSTSMKAFQYNGKWWLGLYISTQHQSYVGKMTITYSRGLPATPTCILYYSRSGGVANEEIYNSIQNIPSSWWRPRTIHNPTTFTQNITAPNITSLEESVAGKSDIEHNHDDRYYTKTEIDTKLGSAPYINTLDIAISSEVSVTMNTFTSSAINAPVATDGLVITHHLSSTRATQLALCGAQLFTRTYSNSTWSAWTAMWNTEES